jgi:hypothetical protein
VGKLGINFIALVVLVLVVVFAWRSKRRGVWVQTGRCYACGAVPCRTDKRGRICADCVQTRVIQRWLGGAMALLAAGVAAFVYWRG